MHHLGGAPPSTGQKAACSHFSLASGGISIASLGVDSNALPPWEEQGFRAELQDALQAEKSEQTMECLDYPSGFNERKLLTRMGGLELGAPRDRRGRFATELFERFQRSKKALTSSLAEMSVQGGAMWRTKTVTEAIAKSDVSLKAFFERHL